MTSTHPVPGGRGARSWTAAESEAYLDSRPVGGPYNPAAEYGDPHWREPESDDEAAARTAHLDAQPRDPETTAWVERVAAISEQEKALVDAGVDLEHAQATHDPDEVADAQAAYDAALAEVQAHELGEAEPGGEPQPGEVGEASELPDWLDGEFTDPEPERDEEEAEL